MFFISEKIVGITCHLQHVQQTIQRNFTIHTHTDQNIHHDLQFQNPPGKLSAIESTTKYSSLNWWCVLSNGVVELGNNSVKGIFDKVTKRKELLDIIGQTMNYQANLIAPALILAKEKKNP